MPPLLLLVDDAAEVIQIVRILARRSGQEIVCRAGADEVLAWLRESGIRPPDLLLIDLHLSGESGIELYRRLVRETDVLTGVPAALFTQGASSVALAQALDAGMDFIVGKELLAQPEAWKERIDEVLQLAREGDAPAQPSCVATRQEPCPPVLNAQRLAAGVWRALLHPVMGKLEEKGIWALWRRALLRSRPGESLSRSDIDVLTSSATLAQYFAHLISTRPELIRDLLLSLGYQVQCLLGRTVSEPVLSILFSALNEAGSSNS
jgi:CheY-like chemotaxis protein